MKKIITLLFLIIALPCILLAQSLSEQDVKAKQRVKELTAELEYHLLHLTDSQITNATRLQSRSAALKLFVGDGEPMMINGMKADELTVEVISDNRTSTRPLKAYLSYLTAGYLENGTKIHLIDYEVYVITNLEIKKETENIYQFKAKRYKCISDFDADRYDTITITLPVCMCCECEGPFIRFGNIKVREMKRR